MFWKLQNKFFLKKQTRFYKQNIDHILFFENHGEKYKSGFSLKKKHGEKCKSDFSFEEKKHGEKKNANLILVLKNMEKKLQI